MIGFTARRPAEVRPSARCQTIAPCGETGSRRRPVAQGTVTPGAWTETE